MPEKEITLPVPKTDVPGTSGQVTCSGTVTVNTHKGVSGGTIQCTWTPGGGNNSYSKSNVRPKW